VVFAYLYEYASTGEIKHEVSSTTTRLGRGSSNDIVLMGDTVSSVHAVLKRERDDSLTLVDLNSSNGTKVNNRPITQETIESGDVIMLGEYSIKIQRIG
jgi:FOG: FHA domain